MVPFFQNPLKHLAMLCGGPGNKQKVINYAYFTQLHKLVSVRKSVKEGPKRAQR